MPTLTKRNIIVAIVFFTIMGVSTYFGWNENSTIAPEGPKPVDEKHNFMIVGDKVVPLTKLTDEQMKIQDEKGCITCHSK